MRAFSPFLLLLTVLAIVCSCGNEPYDGELFIVESDDNPDIIDDFKNSFYAKLNGQEFIVHQIYTTLSTDPIDSNFIAITGSENNYHSIILYLPSDITVGTYYYNPQTIITVPNLNVTYSNLANLLESGIGEGYIVILEHDIANQHIKGRFECVVNSENGSIQHITEGNFDVVYF